MDVGLLVCWFILMSSSGFGTRVMLVSLNEFGSVPSSSFFWKSLRRIDVNSSLNAWKNSPEKPSSLGLFFAERFLITDSISLDLFRFSILHDSVFISYIF